MAMAHEITHINPGKTYASADRARTAVSKLSTDCRFMISYTREGRAFVIFIGQQALHDGLHFSGHVCVG